MTSDIFQRWAIPDPHGRSLLPSLLTTDPSAVTVTRSPSCTRCLGRVLLTLTMPCSTAWAGWRRICVPRSPCSLQVDATKVTRRPRTPTPPCCGVPSGRRGKSLGWGGEATGTQHHLPAYSCAFLQAEREHTLVRPQPEETCPVWIHWPLPPLCSAGETNYSRGEAGEEVTSCRVQTASVVGNPLEHRSGGLCALHTDFHHCPTAACDV